MRLINKVFLWFLGGVALLIAVLAALHGYYRMTPVALSDEAKQLDAETAHMSQLTENGYRLLGLKAPENLDAVAYGKCRVDAGTKHVARGGSSSLSDESPEAAARRKSMDALHQADLAACLQGGKEFLLQDWQPKGSSLKWMPNFNWAALKALPTNAPAVVVSRWNRVLASGHRGQFPDLMMTPYVSPDFTYNFALEQIKLTEFANAWDAASADEDRLSATEALAASIDQWSKFADHLLLDAVMSMAAHQRQLLVLQHAVSMRPTLNQQLAAPLTAALAPIDRAPHSVANSIGAEYQMNKSFNQAMSQGQYDEEEYVVPFFPGALARLGQDPNDSLNMIAEGLRDVQKVVQSKGALDYRETRSYRHVRDMGCPTWGDWGILCSAFERNPVGRFTAALSAPLYLDYGFRAWDTVNLANATRLTIEVRRRGLTGEALARFVASAPAGMRDVYTEKPFTYDVAKQKLTIELRGKSRVLGAKSYELSL